MDIRQQLIENAKSFLGQKYSDMDCSKFIQNVIKKTGYILPRTSVEQAKFLYNKKLTKEISKSTTVSEVIKMLNMGDLVFWWSKDHPERWEGIHHVSIYDKDSYNYESSSSVGHVVRRKLWENSDWQIAFISDITSLFKIQGDDTEMKFKFGDKHEIIGIAQQGLIDLNYSLPKWGVDCKIGSETTKVLNEFKVINNLPQDGILDERVFSLIMSEQSKLIAKQKTDNASLLKDYQDYVERCKIVVNTAKY